MENDIEQPDLYTYAEGSYWTPWAPMLNVTSADLLKRSPAGATDPVVMIAGVRVHSLKFPGNKRWDCVNGFTSR